MRISDWSSDVCSSDLNDLALRDQEGWHAAHHAVVAGHEIEDRAAAGRLFQDGRVAHQCRKAIEVGPGILPDDCLRRFLSGPGFVAHGLAMVSRLAEHEAHPPERSDDHTSELQYQ